MRTYIDLKKDLLDENNKHTKLKSNILNVNIPYLNLYTAKINELIDKYKDDIDLSTFKLNEYYESDTIYLHIGVYRNKDDFYKQLEFVYKNQIALVSWASTDCLYQNFKRIELNEMYKVIEELTKDNNLFIRRLGYLFIFKYVNENNVESFLKYFKNDDEYYVKMVEAWVLEYLYLCDKDLIIKFLKESNLDKWIINKAISKICDSRFVTKEEKENIKKIRRK